MNILFCLPGRSFSGAFLQRWTHLVGFCQTNSINLILSQRYNSNVYYVRSQCLGANVLLGKHQSPFDGKVPYDYVMWIDSDIIFTVQNFIDLLSHKEKDIVSGIYAMDGGLEYPVVKTWDESVFLKNGMFEFLKPTSEDIIKGEIFDVSYVGMGFMLVKQGVFEKIEYPWFAPAFFDFGNNVHDFCSEDVGFCKKARDAGFKIWVDPKIVVLHEKTTLY